MGKVVKAVGKVVGSVFKAVGGFVGMLFSAPKQPKASANTSTETRLNATLVPEESFKIIFGETAVGTDMRFWETFGAGNNGHLQVMAGACHELTSYGNLYLDEKPVSFTGNNATGAFAGLLSRRLVLKGVSGAGIALGSGTRWTAASSMTGCSYYALIWTYNQEKLPQGIPSRVTQVGKGAKVYDPRRDSTRGGSGAHRADNPATWEYLPTDSNGQPIGRNNALQMLAYTLGIKALSPVTGQWELRAGRGADPVDIEFASFIAAANACEIEGWYSDCILSTGDSHGTNEGILEAASGGELVDTGGRFGYHVSTDDTANVAATFNEGDIIGEVDWEPQKPMGDQYNELPGTFVDPTALFQTRPLPLCFSLEYYAADGYKKRAEPEKLSAVQDPIQGQKLLRRKLNRTRFQGVFSAVFNLRALKVKKNDIIKLNFAPLGFANKLFRVVQQGIAKTGGIQLILEEESPLIYLPGAVVAVPAPSVGYGGDPGAAVAVAGLAAFATGVISGTSAVDAVRITFTVPSEVVQRTEGRYRRTGDADWTPLAPLSKASQPGWIVIPMLPTTNYTFEVRHITMFNVPSVWATVAVTTNSVTISPAGLLVYSNGQTVDSLRPGEAGANVTENRTAALIQGQAPWATSNLPVARLDNLSNTGAFNSLANVTTKNMSLLTGRTADYIDYTAGGTVNSLRPGEAGANVTESRTAALVQGQTAWTTWTGRTPDEIEAKTQTLDYAGTLPSHSVWGGAYLNERWPAEGGANVTETRTAALVAGQGPGATAPANRVLNDRYEGGVRYINYPDGGQFSYSAGPQAGQIQIILPYGLEPVEGRNAMIRFSVDIFDYSTGSTVTYTVGGYSYGGGGGANPEWINVSASFIGPRDLSRPVKFGVYLGKGYIWIGNLGDNWFYPSIRIRDVQISYDGAAASGWSTGWQVGFNNTDISTLVYATVTTPRAGDQVFGEGIYEAPGGAVATRPNFRTDQGVAALVAGQSILATLNIPTYASNGEAVSAGQTNGVAYYNTTTGKLDTVIRTPGDGVGTIFATPSLNTAIYGTSTLWVQWDYKDVASVPVGATIDPMVNAPGGGTSSTPSATANFTIRLTEQNVVGGTEVVITEGEVSIVSGDLDLGGGQYEVMASASAYIHYTRATKSGSVRYRLYVKGDSFNNATLSTYFSAVLRIFNP